VKKALDLDQIWFLSGMPAQPLEETAANITTAAGIKRINYS
jgi:hypothetical protein